MKVKASLCLLLLLVANVLQAQQVANEPVELDVFPKEGEVLGKVMSSAPGKWLVMTEDWKPVSGLVLVSEDRKTVEISTKPGRYGVIFFPEGDGQPSFKLLVLGGVEPIPPGPDPNPDPNPPAPVKDNPWGTDTTLNVLILYETGDSYPPATTTALHSTKLKEYIESKSGKALVVDDDYTDELLSDARLGWTEGWKAAYTKGRESADTLPWIIVSGNGGWTSQKLPATEDELLTLVRKYGDSNKVGIVERRGDRSLDQILNDIESRYPTLFTAP